MAEWEEIESVAGAFIGWNSTTTGQHVTGRVVDYTIDGGTDFAGNKCPQVSVELTEPAASFNKAGERKDFPAGEIVNVTCGQASLKSTIRRADPSPGDLIKITLVDFAKTADGTAKVFKIGIARGAGGSAAPAKPAAAASDPWGSGPATPAPASHEPPF
ncbi:hypothetical protein [Mycolicibacterium fortuitum]|uniref:hypothetical protein n=1 Tax=Mycolicibacterium fortuitum TaxID=1766 RepID=UPI0026300008|nr:hypothetical protein [Mycolicibacterium fortuitum]